MTSAQPYACNISHEILKNSSEDHAKNLRYISKNLVNQPPDLLIVTKDGSMLFSRRLLLLHSPIIKSLSDMNIGDSATLLLPDTTLHSIQGVLDLIIKGYSSFQCLSYLEYQHILDTAKLLEIDISFKNVEHFDFKKNDFQNESSNLVIKRGKSEVTSEKKKKRKNNYQTEECKTNQKDKKMRFDKLSSNGALGDKSIKVSQTKEIDFKGEQNKLKIKPKKTSTVKITTKNHNISKVQSLEFPDLGLNKEQLRGFTASKLCTNPDKITPKAHKDNSNIETKSRLDIPFSKGTASKKCKKSAYQLSYLRKEFNKSPILSTDRAQLLSKELFLTRKQIGDWFRFQRQRSKSSSAEQEVQSKVKSMSKIQNGKIIDKLEKEKSKLNDSVKEEQKVIIDKNTTAELVGVPKIKVESQRELYSCSVCPRSFMNKTNLKRHNSVHSDLQRNGDTDSEQEKGLKIDAETNKINHETSKERTELIKLIADKISFMNQNLK